jgi:hypothetical protein
VFLLGIALIVVIAVLLERIPQPPKKPGKVPPHKRAQALAVTATALAVVLGISLAKTPLVGQAIDEGTNKAAGLITARYQPGTATTTTRPGR